MIELGVKKGTLLMEIPSSVLTESVVGKTYHMRVGVRGTLTDSQGLYTELGEGLKAKFKAKLYWIRLDNGVLDIQLQGSPFLWSSVIAWMPSILTIFGLVLVTVAIFSVLSSVPSWAWAILAVGGVLIFIGPTIAKSMKKA